VAGIVMFKTLPRQEFGRVQAKLFPIYFQMSAAMTLLLGGTLLAAGHGFDHKQVRRGRVYNCSQYYYSVNR
jgi:hypothetical protein